MPTGLQIIGDHTIAQIDENFRNLQFKAKGTFTLGTTSIASRPLYANSVTVTADSYPMMAIRSTAKVGFMGFQQSGSSWTFSYAGDTASASVEYFHFDTPPIGETANYLEVIDAAGARVFNALSKPMKVLGSLGPAISTISYTSGRKYAGVQSGTGWSFQEQSPEGGRAQFFRSWMVGQRWPANHQVVIHGVNYSTGLQVDLGNEGSVDITRDAWVPVKVLIVDVTGY